MHGGKRPGAGRKKTRDTPAGKLQEAIKIKALAEGCTPLEVMLEAMRDAYEEGGAIAATVYAKEAAPYLHPRLSSVEANMTGALSYLPRPQPQDIPVEDREPVRTNGHAAP